MSEETGRFLARWAKKKARARRVARELDRHPGQPAGHDEKSHHLTGARAADGAEDASRTGESTANGPAGDAEACAEGVGGLPDIEKLGAGSDFKPFMARDVPADIRNQALKKLWASNPLYNHIDMLDDYCEDYTDAACAVPGIKTAYRVGRGFIEELAKPDDNRDDTVATECDVAPDSRAETGDSAAAQDERVAGTPLHNGRSGQD